MAAPVNQANGEVPNPYVGPRAFRAGEHLYGRERETNQLTNLIIAERIVLFYSPSGAGKTSLIRAALIPRLQGMKFQVLPVARVNLDPASQGNNEFSVNRYIFSAQLSLEEDMPEDERIMPEQLRRMSLAEYLSRRSTHHNGRDVEVLIFDQFEEILTLNPADQAVKREFFDQLGSALEAPNRWALFSMREDFVTALDPYRLPIPSRFSNTFRLDLLGKEAAYQAIKLPASQSGVEFEDAAVEKLVEDLSRVRMQRLDGTLETQPGPYVEPVQLQVVCYRLWEAPRANQRRITVADLDALGELNQSLVDQSLAEYFSQSVAAIAEETDVRERAIREWFDRHLITPGGVRGNVLMEAGTSSGLENRVIWKLVDAHLVRAEQRGGTIWFELAHDRLISPIREDNRSWFKQNLSLLQQRAAIWNEQGRPESLLLRKEDLDSVERWAASHHDELLTAEVDFLRASRSLHERERRTRRLSRLITILGIVSIVLAVIAFVAFLQARQATSEALSQARVARAGMLASNSQASLERFPQLGLLLAIEANSVLAATDPGVPAAEEALRSALKDPHGLFLGGHENDVEVLAFSPGGRWLATASDDNGGAAVRLWDLTTDDPVAEALILGGLGRQVTALSFSPDGRWLSVASEDTGAMTIRLWDFTHGEPASESTTLSGHAGTINTLAFSSDGLWLATGSVDTKTILWDLRDGESYNSIELSGHQSPVRALAFSRDGRWLASGGQNGMVLLWNLNAESTSTVPLSLNNHSRQVTSLAFSQDSRWLATGSLDNTTHLWALSESGPGGEPLILQGQEGGITSVDFSPDSHWLATGSGDATARLWDLETTGPNMEFTELPGHTDEVATLAFSPDGLWLATGSRDNTVRLWDLETTGSVNKDPLILRGHDGPVAVLDFSQDGKWLATGSFDDSARLWELEASGRDAIPITLRGHADQITTLAFSKDDRWLGTGSRDSSVRLWDLQTLSQNSNFIELPGHMDRITTMAFSPNIRWLATGSIDNTARLWNIQADNPAVSPITLRGHTGWIGTLAFSTDDRWLATGSGDTTARLWELQTAGSNTEFIELPGHTDEVTTLAFSPDGRWLATGSSDRTARLWNLRAENPAVDQRTLSGHEASITALAFSPDGRWLATGSSDQTVKLWPVSLDELIHLACLGAGRNLSGEEWQQYFPGETYRKTCEQWPEGS